MTTALVVIDAQESFRADASSQQLDNPNIAGPIGALVDATRLRGQLVVWVLHAEPGSDSVFDPASGHVRVLDELEPRPGEPCLVKTSINAFTTTDLQETLTRHDVTELLICGIRTEQCCETTARLAADLGFEVTFVTDATTTSAIGTLSAAAIIERTEHVLQGRGFARIATTADVVAGAGALAH